MILESKAAVVGLILLLTQLAVGQTAKPLLTYSNPATYEVEHYVEFKNVDVTTLTQLEMNVPVPTNWPSQEILECKTTGDGYFRLKDLETKVHIARIFEKNKFLPRPGESRRITNHFRLVCQEITSDGARLSRENFAAYKTKSAEYQRYTRSEEQLEASDPEIKKIAQTLKAKDAQPYRFARLAYDYVIEHTHYGPTIQGGALGCLKHGQSDCGGYSALFIAICRAGGIPARPVVGCWATGENPWHMWAEFELPGVGWIPVDPSVGASGRRDYYFGNLDNNRLVLAKAINMKFQTDRGTTTHGFIQPGSYFWYLGGRSKGTTTTFEAKLIGKRVKA